MDTNHLTSEVASLQILHGQALYDAGLANDRGDAMAADGHCQRAGKLAADTEAARAPRVA
jgi:hypothetical protein